ncbi:mutS protein homolog 4-like [Epargyreus clarus]|uniref:mutS protein homolog 4-like n=1 Tax=Epargyreus clarus TaxID=520877 RepID=UPI003C2BBE88
MNVVKRDSRSIKYQPKHKNELVRRDASLGIRASTIPVTSFHPNAARGPVKVPRYQFSNDVAGSKRPSMGPPIASPRSLKRKIIQSSSTRPESSSSGNRRRILASDSAAESSLDVTTPKNRPTALRYISSSSRGGHSGTRSARSTSTSIVEASVILAISEGRGMARGEIGMAALDLKHPHLVLCQFSDTLLYTHALTKINYFNPVEIIVPHTFCEGAQSSQLYQLIKEQYPLTSVTAVQRRHFNDAAARHQIQSLCAPQYSAVYLQVLHKFYALTAAAAVLKYVEYIQCIVFARESLKIEYHSSENTMIIDVGTATQLELVQPLVPSAGPTCCLLGVLGPTYTVGGIRALRASLLQPSCKRQLIEARLDAVQELIDNDDGLMVDLQNVIKKLSEVDKILFLCMETPNQNIDKYGEAQIYQTLLLKTTMDMVPSMVEALNIAESAVLRNIKTDLENPHYKEIADRIRSIIQDDAHPEKGAIGSLQRCFAVKPEINGLLDVARRTYSELIEDIQKIVENLSETYDLPLRLNQNVMKGFHIVLPVAPKNRRHFDVKDLPPIFIQVVFNGASVTMSTEELVVLDHQAKESLNEIQKMSNIVISTLLKELRPFMSSLYKLCENVAELDILLALAQASSIGSYIRPDFNNYLDIRNSVHPLLDYNSQVLPVPNDIFASPEHNFTIITGPNMGGKSIYIKQIAILQIMAQLGCFVPATNAVLRLCDRIFSRIGFNDSVELHASTYVFEMKEMQHILKCLTPTSLVIIDELCRGTCIEEGTSISWAICEELLACEAFTFFTTHFRYLTRLQDLYFNVVNRHAIVTEEEIDSTQNGHNRLIYTHKIELGTSKVENYGLALAAKTNLPEETVNLARELAELMNKNTEPQQIRTPQKRDEELLYKLNADVQLESRKHANADEHIARIIQKFKQDNPELLGRLMLEKSEKSSDDELNTNNNEVMINSSIESSNIADELTQVIGMDENGTQSKTDSTGGSGDEELMTETINEINEELMTMSVDNIILPPPFDFQD